MRLRRILGLLVLLMAAPVLAQDRVAGVSAYAGGGGQSDARIYVTSGSSVALNGQCNNYLGAGLTIEWAVVSGCSGCSFSSTSSLTPTVTSVPAGVSRVRLRCSHSSISGAYAEEKAWIIRE